MLGILGFHLRMQQKGPKNAKILEGCQRAQKDRLRNFNRLGPVVPGFNPVRHATENSNLAGDCLPSYSY